MDGMTNLAGIADEDFKEAGESSQPTEESAEEQPELNKSFDSDEMLDDPETIDVLGEKKDVSHEPGKVTKEIIEVSTLRGFFWKLIGTVGVAWRGQEEADAGMAVQDQVHSVLLRQDDFRHEPIEW